MANWKTLLKEVLLADGKIDAAETAMLKKEVYADGIISKSEMMFVISLRKSARKVCKEFEEFFFEAFRKYLLADGIIDASETRLIKSVIFADGKVDANEKAFLTELKKKAKKVDASFSKLLKECGA